MLRHAKSDWQADYGEDDLIRPLAPRGRRAARTVGRFLAAGGQAPGAPSFRPRRVRRRPSSSRCALGARSHDLRGAPAMGLGSLGREDLRP